MYIPREDSYMLAEWVKKLAKGKVLDMGTGTGIQAIAAAQSSKVKSVVAVDIDNEVSANFKANVNHKKISFVKSDLFSNIREKFDFIIFNPPYLPQDKGIHDKALYGGKKGHELLGRFFKKVKNYMNNGGKILIIFSSFTGKEKVDDMIHKSGLKAKKLEKQRIFMEDLYVYLISS